MYIRLQSRNQKPQTPNPKPEFPKTCPRSEPQALKTSRFIPITLQVVTDLVATTRQRPPAPEESSPTKGRKDEQDPDQVLRVVLSCAEDMTIRVWDAFLMDCLQVLRLSTPSGVSATGLPLAGCECRPWCMCVDSDGLLYLGTREGQIQVREYGIVLFDFELDSAVQRRPLNHLDDQTDLK